MNAATPAPHHELQEPQRATWGEPARGQQAQMQSDWSPAATFVRLMLGLALEGGDQLAVRLRQWEIAARTASPQAKGAAPLPDLQRDATLGMLLETQARVGEIAGSLWHASDEVAARLGRGVDVVLQRWPFQLLRPRLMRLRRDVEEAIDEWAALGAREEEQARRLARHAAVSLMDELLDELAKNPEVRDLIEQQSAGLAETAVEGVRERTASADALVERLVHTLLRRHADTATAAPADGLPTRPAPVQPG